MKDRIIALCFFLFILFMGISHIAVLPPFEGYDEEGHFSYIREIAGQGTIPTFGNAYLDQAVLDYRANGPLHYVSIKPFDENGGHTYRSFFSTPKLTEKYKDQFLTEGKIKTFRPNVEKELNWQEQHPPLYYLLMAVPAQLLSGQSLWVQIFGLRLISFLMTLAGMIIGLRATLHFLRRHYERTPIIVTEGMGEWIQTIWRFCGPRMQRLTLYSFCLYPIIMPEFFPEFARMGNDSLCLLLVSLFWSLLLRYLEEEPNMTHLLFMGLTLTLGLLTKAFFLPILGGFLAFMCYRIWIARSDECLRCHRVDHIFYIAPALFIGLIWYLYKWKLMGSFVGHPEYSIIDQSSGLLTLLAKKDTFVDLLYGFYSLPLTISWAGTASLSRPWLTFQWPVLLMPFWMLGWYLVALKGKRLDSLFAMPLWLTLPFLAGLIHHMLVLSVLSGYASTPAWYLHIMLPVFCFVFALGLDLLLRRPRSRRLFTGLTLYAALFLLVVFWGQWTLYAGYSTQDAFKLIVFSDFPLDLPNIIGIWDRLSLIGCPWLAALTGGLGFVCMVAGLTILLLKINEKEPQNGKT